MRERRYVWCVVVNGREMEAEKKKITEIEIERKKEGMIESM